MSYAMTGSFKGACINAIAAAALIFIPAQAFADNLTASNMLQRMNEKEQYHYIAGVVAGFSTFRNVTDGNDSAAACIERWFYDTPNIRKTIYAAFERFGDKAPSAILYALAVKECGK